MATSAAIAREEVNSARRLSRNALEQRQHGNEPAANGHRHGRRRENRAHMVTLAEDLIEGRMFRPIVEDESRNHGRTKFGVPSVLPDTETHCRLVRSESRNRA